MTTRMRILGVESDLLPDNGSECSKAEVPTHHTMPYYSVWFLHTIPVTILYQTILYGLHTMSYHTLPQHTANHTIPSQVPQPTCYWKWVGVPLPLKHHNFTLQASRAFNIAHTLGTSVLFGIVRVQRAVFQLTELSYIHWLRRYSRLTGTAGFVVRPGLYFCEYLSLNFSSIC